MRLFFAALLLLSACATQPTKEQITTLNSEFSRLIGAASQGQISWRLAIASYKAKTAEITPYAETSQLGQYLNYLTELAGRLDNKEIDTNEAQILALEKRAAILGQSAQNTNQGAAAAMLLLGSAIVRDQQARKPAPPVVCQSTVFGGVVRSTCN